MEQENRIENTNKVVPIAEMPKFDLAQLYQCWPGGPIVRDRKDCHEIDRKGSLLPIMHIES